MRPFAAPRPAGHPVERSWPLHRRTSLIAGDDMASHIPLVEDDHVIGLDGKQLAPLPVNAWSGLPFEVHPHMRKGEVAHRYNPHALLLLHVRSHGRSRIRSGHTVFDLALAPGQVDVFCAGFHMDHGSWDCTPGEVLAVEIDPERARSYLHDDTTVVAPSTHLSVRDPVLERLFDCMRSEVDAGCMSGRLFCEGLSLSLLARLSACYGGTETSPRPTRQLSPQQLRQTVDFIDAHIGADLSIATLASQLGMSPYTFAKLFKATVESSPHSFVLSRRIQRAELLLGGPLSLSEIALTVGFTSQSHFTEAFRRRTGRTPSKARRRD
jgi:AraC family transcriptional regulator